MAFRPFFIFLLLCLGAGGAGAQTTSALKNHDTNQPIDIAAQRIEVREKDNIALFDGDVRVDQGKLGLRAGAVRVNYNKGKGDALTILRIDARDGVRMTSPSEKATAQYGIYDVEDRQLTLIGDVVLTKDASVVRGERLVVNLDSGVTTLESPARAGQRVSGRFTVPTRRD